MIENKICITNNHFQWISSFREFSFKKLSREFCFMVERYNYCRIKFQFTIFWKSTYNVNGCSKPILDSSCCIITIYISCFHRIHYDINIFTYRSVLFNKKHIRSQKINHRNAIVSCKTININIKINFNIGN